MRSALHSCFKFVVTIALAFFSLLMANITLKYIPWGRDVAFLQIKQEEVERFWYYLPVFYVHVFSSLLCLPAGFTQFNSRFLKNNRTLHRKLGYLYAGSVLLFAAPSGFLIGLHANGGVVSILFFCTLALLWAWFTLQAVRQAKLGDHLAHKHFMIRSYALALSAITLRLYKVMIVKVWAPPPMEVYVLVSGLSWVPNLIIAEWMIRRKRPGRDIKKLRT